MSEKISDALSAEQQAQVLIADYLEDPVGAPWWGYDKRTDGWSLTPEAASEVLSSEYDRVSRAGRRLIRMDVYADARMHAARAAVELLGPTIAEQKDLLARAGRVILGAARALDALDALPPELAERLGEVRHELGTAIMIAQLAGLVARAPGGPWVAGPALGPSRQGEP